MPATKAIAVVSPARSRVGKADLDQARKLLSDARNELEPRQWELLDNKLVEAQRAWERFNTLASASGEAAEVEREEGIAEVGRDAEAEVIDASPKLSPLFMLLALLWPASTATNDYDEPRPPWLEAELEFEARLKEVSKAAKQVKSEIEVERKAAGGKRKVYKKAWDPAPDHVPDNWVYPPGKRPCNLIGTGGPGLSRPAGIRDRVDCRYDCGGTFREEHFRGNSDEVCRDPWKRPVY